MRCPLTGSKECTRRIDVVPGLVFIAGWEGYPLFEAQYENVILPVLEQVGLRAWRASRELAERALLCHICEGLQSSELAICDLSGARHNVYLETGMAYVFGKPTIIRAARIWATRVPDTFPSDIGGQYRHVYDTDPSQYEEQRTCLLSLLRPLVAEVRLESERAHAYEQVVKKGVDELLASLKPAIEEAKQLDTNLALALVDVDKFVLFRHTYGSAAGDAALRHLRCVLATALRPSDSLYCLGTDAFAIVLLSISEEECAQVLSDLIEAVRTHPLNVQEDLKVGLSVSIGMAFFPRDAATPSTLCRVAQSLLREVKIHGGDGFATSEHRAGKAMFDDDALVDGLRALEEALATADRQTRAHAERVTQYAVAIAEALSLDEEHISHLRLAARFHDIGYVAATPKQILYKSGPLSAEEREEIARHAPLGHLILEQASLPPPVLQAVKHHHEHYNGRGYPEGLCGDQIPLLARIIAVADMYTALTTARPYRPKYAPDTAIRFLQQAADSQLDPALVRVFIELLHSSKMQ